MVAKKCVKGLGSFFPRLLKKLRGRPGFKAKQARLS